ncbi:MAG: hypothetical protein CR966_01000, partial [Pseudomonadales bacterium]
MSNLTLETLYAQPDGKFRSNEKYDKILAEIAKEPPFKKDKSSNPYELIKPRYEEEIYDEYEICREIQAYTQELLAGQAFDFDKFKEMITHGVSTKNAIGNGLKRISNKEVRDSIEQVLRSDPPYKLEDGYNQLNQITEGIDKSSDYIRIPFNSTRDAVGTALVYHLYELENAFDSLEQISATDILDMYVITFLLTFRIKTAIYQAYKFIQRYPNFYDELFARTQYWLSQYSDIKDVKIALQHLFPLELDIDLYEIYGSIYSKNEQIFFDDLPKFISVYYYLDYQYKNMTEAELLWFIVNAPDMLSRFSRMKITRERKTILDRFHHVSVLEFWINMMFSKDSYIEKNWLAKYPLFTLVRLLENDKDRLVKNYLKKNLLVLKPLQELLQEKNNTDALGKLQEITQEFTAKEIAQAEIDFNNLPKDKKALNALKKQNKKPSATTQTKTTKLKWHELQLKRFEHTDTCKTKALTNAKVKQTSSGNLALEWFYNAKDGDGMSTLYESYDGEEGKVFRTNYDDLTLQQRYLTLFVRPSVLVARYQELVSGTYTLTANDYIDFQIGEFRSFLNYKDYEIIDLALRRMEEVNLKLLFQKDFPFHHYIGSKDKVRSLAPIIIH